MRFPLTDELRREAEAFALRSACRDCAHCEPSGACAHGWPNEDQSRWPLGAGGARFASFCKEFELR
ncbi:MAG: hypothetical protein D6689_01040 [Deltaproteobacteria bacterium]|nr:MAG: hypothetical protein D6689_01040 [Deltaproteobacteria bacterium]